MFQNHNNKSFFSRTNLLPIVALALALAPVSIIRAESLQNKIPVIQEDPKDVTVKAGEDAVFSVKAKGDKLIYKWYFNDTAQKDSNGKTVKIDNVKPELDGGKIYVVVSNEYGATTSKVALLNVEKAPSEDPHICTWRAVPGSIKHGQKARLEAVYTGGQGVIEPGGFIIGTKQYLEVSPSKTTTYQLIVTSPDGKTDTAKATVSVKGGNNANNESFCEEEKIMEVCRKGSAVQNF